MAQHDYVIDNQSAPASRADINNAFLAIVTQNAGATAPATTYADMIWYDTANNQIKKRNEANSAWITLGTINETTGKFDPNASFTAVQQGGGTNMGTNKIYIGWDSATGLRAQVDSSPLGFISMNAVAGNTMQEIASQSVGFVGTFAFLASTVNGSIFNPGATVSGSNLAWAGFNGVNGTSSFLQIGTTVGAGTWRVMAYAASDAGTRAATLFMRIA